MAIQDLISRGYRPGIDFGYLYGLLPLLVGRIWYGLAGLSPETFRVQVMACTIFTAWGMARFAAHDRVGLVGIMLIALAIPDLLLVTYIGLVQSLEQALLVNALAEQARGRRGTALALLTACCFVKPSLAVVQGFAVVIAIAVNLRWAKRSTYLSTLVPAVAHCGNQRITTRGNVWLCAPVQDDPATNRHGGLSARWFRLFPGHWTQFLGASTRWPARLLSV